MLRRNPHTEDVGHLVKRLDNKHKYNKVWRNLEVVSSTGQTMTELDVAAIKDNHFLVFEVKTSVKRPDRAYKCALGQAKTFYTAFFQSKYAQTYRPMFIYYNGRAKQIKRIHPWMVLS